MSNKRREKAKAKQLRHNKPNPKPATQANETPALPSSKRETPSLQSTTLPSAPLQTPKLQSPKLQSASPPLPTQPKASIKAAPKSKSKNNSKSVPALNPHISENKQLEHASPLWKAFYSKLSDSVEDTIKIGVWADIRYVIL